MVHTQKITVAVHVPSRSVTEALRRLVRSARSGSTGSSTPGAAQVDSGSQNLARDSRAKAGLNGDVDVMAEQVPKVHQQTAQVEEGPAFRKFDQEIDVARVGRITSHDRAEHTHPRGATHARKLENLAPSIPKIRQRGHGHVITLDRSQQTKTRNDTERHGTTRTVTSREQSSGCEHPCEVRCEHRCGEPGCSHVSNEPRWTH